MRSIPLLLISGALVGCSTAPPAPEMRTAQAQQEYQRLLAGKTAGAPLSCLPTFRADDMRVIDDSTVIFRQSGNRAVLGHFAGGCNMLGQPGYALVTKQFGTSGLCHGDIATVVDTHTGFTVGSCVIGDFVPYTAG